MYCYLHLPPAPHFLCPPSDQAGLRAVFVPLGTIAALVGLISTALFWRQRLAYPIKGRLPMMVVASNVAGIVYILAITLHISLLDTYPCILHYSQRVVMEMAIFSIYTVRILALQFKFLLTAELAAEVGQMVPWVHKCIP